MKALGVAKDDWGELDVTWSDWKRQVYHVFM